MTDEEPDPSLPELAALRREADPPKELQDRVVSALRGEGLLRSPWPLRSWATAAAAFVLALVTGFALGRASGPSDPFPPTFVLFLREGPAYRQPADTRERVLEYVAWVRRLRQAGVRVTGEELRADAELLGETGQGADRAPITGLFLVQADGEPHARKIAQECPHLKHGGTVELRPIEPTP